jgi:hypothetical protein
MLYKNTEMDFTINTKKLELWIPKFNLGYVKQRTIFKAVEKIAIHLAFVEDEIFAIYYILS